MAKKSKFIDLKKKNIQYEQDNTLFTLYSYNQINMTVNLFSAADQQVIEIPFAHLPKKMKKIINPQLTGKDNA